MPPDRRTERTHSRHPQPSIKSSLPFSIAPNAANCPSCRRRKVREALTPRASTVRRTIADELHSKRDRFQGIRNEVCSLVGSKSLSLSRRSKLGKDVSSSCTRRCPLGVGAQPDELLKSRSSWNICRGRCNARLMAGWLSNTRAAARVPFRSSARTVKTINRLRSAGRLHHNISYPFRCPGGLQTRGFSLRRGVFDGSTSEGTWGKLHQQWLAVQ